MDIKREILKDSNNKRYYSNVLYPSMERELDDIYIISRIGDRLDLLAYDYYGDTTKWKIIATANGIGLGTLTIQPGLQIRIPRYPGNFEQELNK